MKSEQIASELKANIILRLRENTPRIEKCLNQLSEEQVWYKPNENLNSVGNLILHLCGNITQYIISSIGGEKDNRVRDDEFSIAGGVSKKELIDKISEVVAQSCAIIKGMHDEDLLKVRSVQGFTYTGIANLIHVAEHYSYHTGQIAFLTKLIVNKDLGFYADMDLNIKNKKA
jgi:uncharacterized damage-inducible protein DinB